MTPAIGEASPTTPDRLLDAGLAVFARHGFDGATAELIAREAGVNKAMINYHFGGKEQLYAAIFERAMGAVAERIEAAGPGPGATAPERLAAYVETWGRLHTERPELAVVMLRELIGGGHRVPASLMPRLLRIFNLARMIVAQGVAEGSFRPVDPLLTHLAIVGSLVFFFATSPFRDRVLREAPLPAPAPTAEAFVAHLRDLVVGSLTNPPAVPAELPPASPAPRT